MEVNLQIPNKFVRMVIRDITPGTLISLTIEPLASTYLVLCSYSGDPAGTIAIVDVDTGMRHFRNGGQLVYPLTSDCIQANPMLDDLK